MQKKKKQLPIIPNGANWRAAYNDKVPAGPAVIEIDGKPIVTDCYSACDELTDNLLLADKIRLYRKAGTAIFEGSGHFPFGAGLTMRNVMRYDVNTMRATTDIRWKPATPVKDSIQIQSFSLTGDWKHILVIPDFKTFNETGKAEWTELPADGKLEFSPCPLAVVFENADGVRVETGLGSDVWRWNAGLCLHQAPVHSMTVEINAKNLKVTRCVEVAPDAPENPEEQPKMPEVRDFRFNSYLAWSQTPAPVQMPEKLTELSICDASGLNHDDLKACGENPAICVDFTKMNLPNLANRDGRQGGLCWDSALTQRVARRIVRQLSEYSSQGTVEFIGLEPGLCTIGKHCERRNAAPHWDHASLLDFSAWMKQRLRGWTISIPVKGLWSELPSLSCLAAPACFGAEEDEPLED